MCCNIVYVADQEWLQGESKKKKKNKIKNKKDIYPYCDFLFFASLLFCCLNVITVSKTMVLLEKIGEGNAL